MRSDGRAKLIAVTILTSLSDDDIWAAGFETAKDTQAHAARAWRNLRARRGSMASCAARTMWPASSSATGTDFLTVVPGIRPADAATQDQKRIATPPRRIAAGADILVIGRAITGAADPGKRGAAISWRGLHDG